MSMHAGSLNSFMAQLVVGQSVVVPCGDKNDALLALRRVTAKSRYPVELEGREFTGRMVTVVGDIGEAIASVQIARSA